MWDKRSNMIIHEHDPFNAEPHHRYWPAVWNPKG